MRRVTLVRATAADLPEVVAMERDCYSDPWSPSSFVSLPFNDRVFFVLARDEVTRRLWGYVVAWYVMEEGELANLAVARDERGKGIGGALLDAVLQDAAARGVVDVFLEVRESNAIARHLYATRGFEELNRRKDYYRRPVEDALILRRRI